MFDAEESCYKLKIFGVGELSRHELVQMKNPVNGENLKVCYDNPDDPHHMIIDNVPCAHEHAAEAEALAGDMARSAERRQPRTDLQLTRD